MYLNILYDVLMDLLTNEGDKKKPIEIELTPVLYQNIQRELNEIIRFNTSLPIDYIIISTIKFYDRSITIKCGSVLNHTFEKHMVETFTNMHKHNINSKLIEIQGSLEFND